MQKIRESYWLQSTWAIPIILACLSAMGLYIALVVENWIDYVGAIFLGFPILCIVLAWYGASREDV